jgi:hypothetical protein
LTAASTIAASAIAPFWSVVSIDNIVEIVSDDVVSQQPAGGTSEPMADKTDYSPVVEESGDAEKRRERRKWAALLAGAHVFWIYAATLAGIILLVIYLTGGFGAGSD